MKIVPAQSFRDDGWLIEVNRQFFHPRGFALELIAHVDDTVRDHLIVCTDDGGHFAARLIDHRKEGGIKFGEFDPGRCARIARLPPLLREVESIDGTNCPKVKNEPQSFAGCFDPSGGGEPGSASTARFTGSAGATCSSCGMTVEACQDARAQGRSCCPDCDHRASGSAGSGAT